eukprot:5020088-Prymnesium_polylepis.2
MEAEVEGDVIERASPDVAQGATREVNGAPDCEVRRPPLSTWPSQRCQVAPPAVHHACTGPRPQDNAPSSWAGSPPV